MNENILYNAIENEVDYLLELIPSIDLFEYDYIRVDLSGFNHSVNSITENHDILSINEISLTNDFQMKFNFPYTQLSLDSDDLESIKIISDDSTYEDSKMILVFDFLIN